MIKQEENLSNQISFISHEIRNNLSICDMYTQILKKNMESESIDNPSILNAIECIQKSVQIINSNLIELKSLNSNSLKISDFRSMTLKGIEMAKACIDDKDIDLEVFIKNSANILADENKFISCIINIIKNGIEAINIKGTIKVLGEIKNSYAILKISNNGKVIPKNKWEKIFETGYTSKETGCGLGLRICKQYLENQNSTLKVVKSTKSETVFEIKIPVYNH